jgi:glycosyltransferase involved in cell wall biosynthesis
MCKSPLVSIVTRTRDRAVFLRRVLKTLSFQTFTDFEWIIVNDSGARAPVNEIKTEAERCGIATSLIHVKESQGIEAAANKGVSLSRGQYVLIHDDDDTLHPEFLQKTVSLLNKNKSIAGCIAYSTEVYEMYSGGSIIEVLRRPFVFRPARMSLGYLAVCNRYPPIAFLFRKDVYDQVGGYDEELSVLGDWDFNLRVCGSAKIGVIRKSLANYHIRINGTGASANTIIRQSEEHLKLDEIVRFRYKYSSNELLHKALMRGAHKKQNMKAPIRYRLHSLYLKLVGKLPLHNT